MNPGKTIPDRTFSAYARPNGHPELGLDRPVIDVFERTRRGLAKVRVLTLPEAEALHHELGQALRAFDLAKELAREVAIEVGMASSSAAVGQQERPRPYLGPYPIRGKTLAEVDAEERPASSSAAVGQLERGKAA